jgi:hypothetical protein
VAEPNDSPFQQTDPREALEEVLRTLRRNAARVVFTTLVALMMGYGLTMVWPAKFASNTTFMMRNVEMMTGEHAATRREDLSGLTETKKLQALANELRSRRRIDSVMNELQWPEWLETAGKESERRDLALKLAENLEVDMQRDVTGSYMITIGFQWTSPRKAADFVNRLRDAWIQLTMEGFKQNIEDEVERQEKILRDRESDLNEIIVSKTSYELENNVSKLLTAEANQALMVDWTPSWICCHARSWCRPRLRSPRHRPTWSCSPS